MKFIDWANSNYSLKLKINPFQTQLENFEIYDNQEQNKWAN